ncbi:MAG: uroporphyrinogen-III synthase, partial [Helicobacteraceae bacterium]|nr:uroporphyrinogen-III synthase [Helicobacteraceae bacterium]
MPVALYLAATNKAAILANDNNQSALGKRAKTAARAVVALSIEGAAGAIHLPAIETVLLETTADLSGFDAVIFTSKQAVKALDRLDSAWKKLKVFTIGAATSKAVTNLGGSVFFESRVALGDKLAEAIAARHSDLRFFYPRAREVLGDLEGILARKNVACQSLAIYETRAKAIDVSLIPNDAAIVFTSPSVVKSFFAQTAWQSGWRAIALGKSAAKA